MRYDMEHDYPAGELDELAVCYVHKSEVVWSFERVADRVTAERLFHDARDRADVHKVLVDGRPSAVAWVAKCTGDAWLRIKLADGADEYYKGIW
jgi:hypothetical protein